MWYYSLQYICNSILADTGKSIERLANIFMAISAIALSISPAMAIQVWPFIGFMVGHIIWVGVAIKMKKRTLIEFNVGFLLLDIWAIGIRL